VFSYIQQRDKVGFKEALYRLAERVGVRRPNQDDESRKKELERIVERREVQRLLTVAAAYYHAVVPTKIRENLYREHYGFTDETIDSLHLGWADGHLFAHLTEDLGIGREPALQTGLFVVLKGGAVADFFQKRLVFPYWKAGQVVYFVARATPYTGDEEWEKAKYKKLLTHSARHNYVSTTVGNDAFYNEDAVHGAEELLITEGVTDCISARQAGVACISPVTTRFRKQDVPRLIELTRHARRIVICNDAESSGAGEAGARETAAALGEAGRDVRIALIPRPEGVAKIDVNELVTTGGPGALREVLAAARSFPDYLLDRVPKETPKSELDTRLVPVLEALVGSTPIVTDAGLDAIAAKFDVRRRALTKRFQQITAKKGAEKRSKRISSMPEIQVNRRQLRDIVNDARRVVSSSNERRIQEATAGNCEDDNAPLFVREGRLARLHRPKSGAPGLADVSETGMFGYLMREADWLDITEEKEVPVFPPKDVGRDLIAYPPPTVPTVEMVITTPVFGRGGQLLDEPGLHEQDRLWLETHACLDVGDIPQTPTAEEITAARSLFMEDLLVDFPFADEADRAHALAAILLPFVRRMIDGFTPLHVVEAPSVGSGKGLLCNLISTVVTGKSCESRTLPESEDEVRKALTAELTLARPIILLDNAKEGWTLTSAALASVLTTHQWKDRLLGKSEMLSLPVTATWLLTGNNVRLSKDLARRSVRIRIAPKEDQAWLRDNFKHDPIAAWAAENRNALVSAALVLVRAWLAAGRPLGKARLGSYEQWAGVMGGLLDVIGVRGFLGNIREMYESADVEGASLREFVAAWWEEYTEAEMNVHGLVALCERQDLMLQVRGDGSTRSQQSRLGRALHGMRDRVFGQLQVVVLTQDRKKRTVYRLRPVNGEVPMPAPVQEEDHDSTGEVDPWG
jgi:DNA primase